MLLPLNQQFRVRCASFPAPALDKPIDPCQVSHPLDTSAVSIRFLAKI